MITAEPLSVELVILIVIGRRLKLLKCAFGPFLSIHSVLFPIILFALLSIVVYVVDITSKYAIHQLSTSMVLSRCLRTEIIANNLKLVII